ncbi:hypothetical protein GWK47_015722 [Chionoecetes opilio]|uniref:Uncharacterized protein n=1 Tax=Chionoecetes opilio TaxID=41210 RepID=A0A8J5BZL4_CHIOP|nr:hypothetical protein GWK47_015722 [Chionoecetes opilio]
MELTNESILQLKKMHHDMVMKRRRLDELKKNVGLLILEALQHQQKLVVDSADQRILAPSTMLNLEDSRMNVMNKKCEVQQTVSLSGLSQVKVGVERVVGFMEEPEALPPPQRHQQEEQTEDSVLEKGVFKLYETEGTIGDTAYSAAFIVKNYAISVPKVTYPKPPSQPDEGRGKVTELRDLRLGTQSSVTKMMATPGRVAIPGMVHTFTTNLYYHKVLHDERVEALHHLEVEVPGVEVAGHSEPVVVEVLSGGEHQVEVLSGGQHQVKVVWALAWDEPNSRFKYNISINTADEVVARYSTSDVHPYLSGKQKLLTPQDVISFAETHKTLVSNNWIE